MIDFSKAKEDAFASDKDIMELSARIIEENREACQECYVYKGRCYEQ